MSLSLVRQALEFVDQEEGDRSGRDKRRAAAARRQGASGQDHRHLYKQKGKKTVKEENKPKEQAVEENINKLLALSRSTVDSAVTEKIVERAIKGKPLADKIEVRTKEEKSILFPDEEPFEKFEKDFFCS